MEKKRTKWSIEKSKQKFSGSNAPEPSDGQTRPQISAAETFSKSKNDNWYIFLICVLFTRQNLQLVEQKTDFRKNIIGRRFGDGSFNFEELALLLVEINDWSGCLKVT